MKVVNVLHVFCKDRLVGILHDIGFVVALFQSRHELAQLNLPFGAMYEKANVASGLLQYDGTIGVSVKNLAGLLLLFNPGERFEYSLGVDVLGRLIELVSGQPLDEFFRTRIFEPLGWRIPISIRRRTSWTGSRPPTLIIQTKD
jgi:hypothetical protein